MLWQPTKMRKFSGWWGFDVFVHGPSHTLLNQSSNASHNTSWGRPGSGPALGRARARARPRSGGRGRGRARARPGPTTGPGPAPGPGPGPGPLRELLGEERIDLGHDFSPQLQDEPFSHRIRVNHLQWRQCFWPPLGRRRRPHRSFPHRRPAATIFGRHCVSEPSILRVRIY